MEGGYLPLSTHVRTTRIPTEELKLDDGVHDEEVAQRVRTTRIPTEELKPA